MIQIGAIGRLEDGDVVIAVITLGTAINIVSREYMTWEAFVSCRDLFSRFYEQNQTHVPEDIKYQFKELL